MFATWKNELVTVTATVLLEVPSLDDVARLDDRDLIEPVRRWAEARRVVDAGLATLAGVVAARSTVELGYAGLAQRAGLRTADALVSQLTGTSGPEARAITAVGTMLNEPQPWLGEVVARVSAGELSIGAAAAIQSGLGAPSPTVAADDLADAAHALLIDMHSGSGDLPPEKVARRARELRDELDASGVVDREAALREKRFLRLIPQSDGMTRLIGLLDPESAALVTDAVDAVTAPRRGGPRFVDPGAAARADAIVRDEGSTEQLALDALVEMVRIAVAADAGRVFGSRQPAVRVHVALSDLRRGTGVAQLEGQTSAVSVQTAERVGCADGLLGIVFDDKGTALRLGRSRGRFSDKQRAVLAAIWGGCAAPGCDRPPSWTEAHHIDEWQRDHGSTDVDNGILLCRHHHLLVHNNGWRVRRRGTEYLLEPPPGDSLSRDTRELIPKNPVHRRMLAHARAESISG
jgi:hypothetical protein